MKREAAACRQCGSEDFAIETWETEISYEYSVYCRNCLLEEYNYSFPKEEAFK